MKEATNLKSSFKRHINGTTSSTKVVELILALLVVPFHLVLTEEVPPAPPPLSSVRPPVFTLATGARKGIRGSEK